jgi:hypothetical protein
VQLTPLRELDRGGKRVLTTVPGQPLARVARASGPCPANPWPDPANLWPELRAGTVGPCFGRSGSLEVVLLSVATFGQSGLATQNATQRSTDATLAK